jgi:hypothetical protein
MAGQRSPLPWVAGVGLLAVLALGGVRALRRRA